MTPGPLCRLKGFESDNVMPTTDQDVFIWVDEIHKLGSVMKDAHTAVLLQNTAARVASVISQKAAALDDCEQFAGILESARSAGGAVRNPAGSPGVQKWSGHTSLCLLLESLAGFAWACVYGVEDIPGFRGDGTGVRFHPVNPNASKHGVIPRGATECTCLLCEKGCMVLAWETLLCWFQGWGFLDLPSTVEGAANVYSMYDANVSRGIDLELLRPTEEFITVLQECLAICFAAPSQTAVGGRVVYDMRSLNQRFLPYIQLTKDNELVFGITAKHVRPYVAEFEAMYKNIIGFSATPNQPDDVRDMEGWSSLAGLSDSAMAAHQILGTAEVPIDPTNGRKSVFACFYTQTVDGQAVTFTQKQLDSSKLGPQIITRTGEEILDFARMIAPGKAVVVSMPSTAKMDRFMRAWACQRPNGGTSIWEDMTACCQVLIGDKDMTLEKYQRAVDDVDTGRGVLFFISAR